MTSPQRSQTMRAVKSRDTSPELFVRKLAHRLGYRFRLYRRDLPGKPDLTFTARRAVIFVHGCFWHGHTCRRGARIPVANRDYWQAKIARNIARDKAAMKRLRSDGWRILTLWECQLRSPKLARKISDFLG